MSALARTGTVTAANPKGIQLDGELNEAGKPRYINYTLKADPPLPRAAVGDVVVISQSGDWINSLDWLNADPAPAPAPGPTAQRDRETTMLRCSALKQAVAAAAGRELSSDDVLKVAGKFLAWLQAD